jgi:hypothetical protein
VPPAAAVPAVVPALAKPLVMLFIAWPAVAELPAVEGLDAPAPEAAAAELPAETCADDPAAG